MPHDVITVFVGRLLVGTCRNIPVDVTIHIHLVLYREILLRAFSKGNDQRWPVVFSISRQVLRISFFTRHTCTCVSSCMNLLTYRNRQTILYRRLNSVKGISGVGSCLWSGWKPVRARFLVFKKYVDVTSFPLL